MELSPSEVRDVVLADHEAIRVRIGLLRRAIERGEASELRQLMGGMLDHLSSHLDLEDQILVPTLEHIDAWGPERARRLASEHAEQRQWIADAREGVRRGADSGERLAEQARSLIDRLEVDMRHEEESVLDPELLTDAVIQVDFGG